MSTSMISESIPAIYDIVWKASTTGNVSSYCNDESLTFSLMTNEHGKHEWKIVLRYNGFSTSYKCQPLTFGATDFFPNRMPTYEVLALSPSPPPVPDKSPYPLNLQFIETLDDVGYPFLLVDFELEQAHGSERSKRRTVGWAKRKKHPTRETILSLNERGKLLERWEIDMKWLEALEESADGEATEGRGSGGQDI